MTSTLEMILSLKNPRRHPFGGFGPGLQEIAVLSNPSDPEVRAYRQAIANVRDKEWREACLQNEKRVAWREKMRKVLLTLLFWK